MLTSPADLVAIAKATIRECSITEAHESVNSDTLLIDVREPTEFRKAHIPGSVHLPRGLLEFEIHGLVERRRSDENVADADRPIVLYCGTGGRSALAAQSMQSLGYRNAASMAGGIIAWAAAGLPVDTPD